MFGRRDTCYGKSNLVGCKRGSKYAEESFWEIESASDKGNTMDVVSEGVKVLGGKTGIYDNF